MVVALNEIAVATTPHHKEFLLNEQVILGVISKMSERNSFETCHIFVLYDLDERISLEYALLSFVRSGANCWTLLHTGIKIRNCGCCSFSSLEQCCRLIKDAPPPKFVVTYTTIFPSQNIRESDAVCLSVWRKNCSRLVTYQSGQSNRNSFVGYRPVTRGIASVRGVYFKTYADTTPKI